MATPVIMPRQGNSVESCIITKWNKQLGDKVSTGDILFSYETDKASFEEEAKQDGQLIAVFFKEGDDVPCLTNVCVIGEAGEDGSKFAPGGDAPEADAQPAPEAAAPAEATVSSQDNVTAVPASLEKISPRAKKLAEDGKADLSQAQATGPDGRVIARDVQKLLDEGKVVTPAARAAGYAGGKEGTGLGGRVTLADLKNAPAAEAAPVAATAAPAPVEAAPETWEEPLPNIRKVIARQMHLSLSTMAQLTHNVSFDCIEIMALRKQFKEQGAAYGMDKVTLNDIVLFAVSRILAEPQHKALNAHFLDDRMKYFSHVQLGMACDTPRGLMVPTIRNADLKSLKEISDEAKKLASACQTGSVDPDLLQGGSFTVSNLGSLDVESFTPVINPPQTGILGVNTITTRVRLVNGQPEYYQAMSLSLTYDHRALDGAPASRFLKELKQALEHFTLILAKG